MQRYFSEKAITQMRAAIAEAGGNEVFFLGRTDAQKLVIEAEPLARGNRDAVAAIMIAASFGDVVVHNHPSGELTPSQADLEIASLMGNQGVGFYIIDNRAERCYAAVSPFEHKVSERLSFPEMERFFSPGGPLAEKLKGYEQREEQLRMSLAVAEAFNEERVAVIEAGTGTGKSLAYLFPAILWAVRNKERVVVSTNTINLQEQLIKKEIPFLQKKGGLAFRAVLVKGRHNYLCLRRLEGLKAEPSLFKDDPNAGELDAIIGWSEKTGDGCLNDLSFIPRNDTWEEVCCEADQCNRTKCPFYGRCFFYGARREASAADILVTNHALLMSDLALRQETGYNAVAVLPPFSRLIIDEGHHLEDVATSHLTSQTSRQGLLKILSRLQHPRKAQRGVLPQLSSRLSKETPEALDDLYMEISAILEGRMILKRHALSEIVSRTMDSIGAALLDHLGDKGESKETRKLRVVGKVYEAPFWPELEERAEELARQLLDYVSAVASFIKACNKLPDKVLERFSSDLADLNGVKGRLEGAASDLLAFISRTEGVCRWFELKTGGKGMVLRLCSSPLEVAQSLKEVMLDKFSTVVVTSATLTVGGSFRYLEGRTGISLLEKGRVSELILRSPFDYATQALVGIPEEMPDPTGREFEGAVAAILLRALAISQGRAFVLFTSYDLLTRVYNGTKGELEKLGLTPMRQGDMHRHLLLSRFKKGEKAVLFGTDSFWEGVDVKGSALEMVVITRLPFRVPTEPILEARGEHIAATGGDPFMEFTVPQAVIKFEQGFGRLIRSRSDRGAVLILDRRIISKNYGRIFMKSLPPARMARGSGEEVLAELARFFDITP